LARSNYNWLHSRTYEGAAKLLKKILNAFQKTDSSLIVFSFRQNSLFYSEPNLTLGKTIGKVKDKLITRQMFRRRSTTDRFCLKFGIFFLFYFFILISQTFSVSFFLTFSLKLIPFSSCPAAIKLYLHWPTFSFIFWGLQRPYPLANLS
jgi:hypothetical protein